MPAAPIALACWLLPSAVVIGCYLLSLQLGQVRSCVPFFEGCVSISAAARQDPAIHLFRAVILPASTLIAGYWLLVYAWLTGLGERGSSRGWITGLGVIGALFLVLYAVFLGTEGRAYGLMRRYGVTVYFAFTALAQLLLAARLHKLPVAAKARLGRGVIGPKIAIGATMLALGLVNIPAANFFEAFRIENVIEWNFALLMHGYFVLTAIAWRRMDYRISASQHFSA
jgi:hypothetical protein